MIFVFVNFDLVRVKLNIARQNRMAGIYYRKPAIIIIIITVGNLRLSIAVCEIRWPPSRSQQEQLDGECRTSGGKSAGTV